MYTVEEEIKTISSNPPPTTNSWVIWQQSVSILELQTWFKWSSQVAPNSSVIQCLNGSQVQMKLSNLKCIFGSDLSSGQIKSLKIPPCVDVRRLYS
jgi:hypothetical protein